MFNVFANSTPICSRIGIASFPVLHSGSIRLWSIEPPPTHINLPYSPRFLCSTVVWKVLGGLNCPELMKNSPTGMVPDVVQRFEKARPIFSATSISTPPFLVTIAPRYLKSLTTSMVPLSVWIGAASVSSPSPITISLVFGMLTVTPHWDVTCRRTLHCMFHMFSRSGDCTHIISKHQLCHIR